MVWIANVYFVENAVPLTIARSKHVTDQIWAESLAFTDDRENSWTTKNLMKNLTWRLYMFIGLLEKSLRRPSRATLIVGF